MKYFPWVLAAVAGLVGAIASGGDAFVGGISAAGGVIVGEIIKALLSSFADKRVKKKDPHGTEYTPEQWERYKKDLK